MSFGRSRAAVFPAAALFQHFGITAAAVAARAQHLLGLPTPASSVEAQTA